jgi:hypothetical protein
MSDLSAIKKKLGLSSTVPAGTAGTAPAFMTGSHLRPASSQEHGHSHGAGCECCHPVGDSDEDED